MRVVVCLRTSAERRIALDRRPNCRLALVAGSILAALALSSFSVCFWRWGFELEVLNSFPFYEGLASRWQVWFGLGMAFQLLASSLLSYGRTPLRSRAVQRGIRSLPSRRTA